MAEINNLPPGGIMPCDDPRSSTYEGHATGEAMSDEWKNQMLGSWNREDSAVVFLNSELERLSELGYDRSYVNALSKLEWKRPGTEDYSLKNRDDLDITVDQIFRLKQMAHGRPE